MDYSTISNKTGCTETVDITNGDLTEKYFSLKKQFDNLSSSYDATKQELHEMTRNYNTALDVQRYLSTELESNQANQAKEARCRNELNSKVTKLQEDISALHDERTELSESHAKEVKKFEDEIRRLKEENAFKEERKTPERDTGELDEARAALSAALEEAAAVKAALQAEIASWRLRSEELVAEMGQMREAAELRREELRAAAEREAAALADLTEARAMLYQPDEGPEHAAKGNSIFAEVEDKRQEMAKTLIQMKQTNARLRRDLANKQSEVEALLHEKQTIWEQQAGDAAHYDRELIESYSERITQLEDMCERQRRELSRWFKSLKESSPPARPEPGWLPAVLDHLKTEVDRLRAEVLSLGAGQLGSAAQLRDLRRKLALLSAAGAGAPPGKPSPEQTDGVDKGEVPVYKPMPMPTKRMTPDDVRKKVSFN